MASFPLDDSLEIRTFGPSRTSAQIDDVAIDVGNALLPKFETALKIRMFATHFDRFAARRYTLSPTLSYLHGAAIQTAAMSTARSSLNRHSSVPTAVLAPWRSASLGRSSGPGRLSEPAAAARSTVSPLAVATGQRRHIWQMLVRSGPAWFLPALITGIAGYIGLLFFKSSEMNQRRVIARRIRQPQPELRTFKPGPLFLSREEKIEVITDLFGSDPSGPIVITGPQGSGKTKILKQCLAKRAETVYLDLRAQPATTGEAMSLNFIQSAGYIMPPNNVAIRMLMRGGATNTSEQNALEVEKGFRLISEVLRSEKARGWKVVVKKPPMWKAAYNKVRKIEPEYEFVPPLLCIDELNTGDQSGLLDDAAFWRFVDWTVFLTDNRLCHVVYCTSLDVADALDAYPGFRMRRQHIHIDFPRQRNVETYLATKVNPLLESVFFAVNREKLRAEEAEKQRLRLEAAQSARQEAEKRRENEQRKRASTALLEALDRAVERKSNEKSSQHQRQAAGSSIIDVYPSAPADAAIAPSHSNQDAAPSADTSATDEQQRAEAVKPDGFWTRFKRVWGGEDALRSTGTIKTTASSHASDSTSRKVAPVAATSDERQPSSESAAPKATTEPSSSAASVKADSDWKLDAGLATAVADAAKSHASAKPDVVDVAPDASAASLAAPVDLAAAAASEAASKAAPALLQPAPSLPPTTIVEEVEKAATAASSFEELQNDADAAASVVVLEPTPKKKEPTPLELAGGDVEGPSVLVAAMRAKERAKAEHQQHAVDNKGAVGSPADASPLNVIAQVAALAVKSADVAAASPPTSTPLLAAGDTAPSSGRDQAPGVAASGQSIAAGALATSSLTSSQSMASGPAAIPFLSSPTAAKDTAAPLPLKSPAETEKTIKGIIAAFTEPGSSSARQHVARHKHAEAAASDAAKQPSDYEYEYIYAPLGQTHSVIYTLDPHEIKTISEVIGGQLTDLHTVVTAITTSKHWRVAVERLVADSVEQVERTLDSLLASADSGGQSGGSGGAGGNGAGGRKSRFRPAGLSRGLGGPLPSWDYHVNPKPDRLAAYQRYLRAWALISELSRSKYLMKRKALDSIFSGVPHELDYLIDAGLVMSINTRSMIKVDLRRRGAQDASETADDFIEASGNLLTAASPRMRRAFQALVKDASMQRHAEKVRIGVRLALLREEEAMILRRMPEIVSERAYWFQQSQSLLNRDTALRTSVAKEFVSLGAAAPVQGAEFLRTGAIVQKPVPVTFGIPTAAASSSATKAGSSTSSPAGLSLATDNNKNDAASSPTSPAASAGLSIVERSAAQGAAESNAANSNGSSGSHPQHFVVGAEAIASTPDIPMLGIHLLRRQFEDSMENVRACEAEVTSMRSRLVEVRKQIDECEKRAMEPLRRLTDAGTMYDDSDSASTSTNAAAAAAATVAEVLAEQLQDDKRNRWIMDGVRMDEDERRHGSSRAGFSGGNDSMTASSSFAFGASSSSLNTGGVGDDDRYRGSEHDDHAGTEYAYHSLYASDPSGQTSSDSEAGSGATASSASSSGLVSSSPSSSVAPAWTWKDRIDGVGVNSLQSTSIGSGHVGRSGYSDFSLYSHFPGADGRQDAGGDVVPTRLRLSGGSINGGNYQSSSASSDDEGGRGGERLRPVDGPSATELLSRYSHILEQDLQSPYPQVSAYPSLPSSTYRYSGLEGNNVGFEFRRYSSDSDQQSDTGMRRYSSPSSLSVSGSGAAPLRLGHQDSYRYGITDSDGYSSDEATLQVQALRSAAPSSTASSSIGRDRRDSQRHGTNGSSAYTTNYDSEDEDDAAINNSLRGHWVNPPPRSDLNGGEARKSGTASAGKNFANHSRQRTSSSSSSSAASTRNGKTTGAHRLGMWIDDSRRK